MGLAGSLTKSRKHQPRSSYWPGVQAALPSGASLNSEHLQTGETSSQTGAASYLVAPSQNSFFSAEMGEND